MHYKIFHAKQILGHLLLNIVCHLANNAASIHASITYFILTILQNNYSPIIDKPNNGKHQLVTMSVNRLLTDIALTDTPNCIDEAETAITNRFVSVR